MLLEVEVSFVKDEQLTQVRHQKFNWKKEPSCSTSFLVALPYSTSMLPSLTA
jgi:hypothetical protein